ncbi:MAG: hypothetical protein AB7K52_07115 [Phycisphaerales bacterium]
MSGRGMIVAGLAVVVVASVVLAWPLVRLVRALERERAAQSALSQALQIEQEIASLRASIGSRLLSRPPEGDVAAAVQSAMRDAGLPVQLLAEVAPQGSTVIKTAAEASGAVWRRQSVLVRLHALPLPDLGSFLDRWRAAHAEWSVAQIELQVNEPRGPSDAREAGMFSPRITLVASSLDRTEP